jgi:7-alpha-hydroxysteroid dehydrogenase
MGVLDRFALEGRVAVVTGASKGIGRGIALCLAEAGADVALAARNLAELEKVAAEVHERGRRAATIVTDATNVAQIDRLATEAERQLGTPSIWVSNAGGLPDATARYLTRTSEAEWDAQVDLNLKAVWAGAVAAARVMAETGGVIINISSRTAHGPQSKNGPYGAAKAAVNSLTETLSVELGPAIRVNAVAPGPIPTQNFYESTGFDPANIENVGKVMRVPLGRLGTPDDIGAAVVFLASDAASWVTGQCLYVTGGL